MPCKPPSSCNSSTWKTQNNHQLGSLYFMIFYIKGFGWRGKGGENGKKRKLFTPLVFSSYFSPPHLNEPWKLERKKSPFFCIFTSRFSPPSSSWWTVANLGISTDSLANFPCTLALLSAWAFLHSYCQKRNKSLIHFNVLHVFPSQKYIYINECFGCIYLDNLVKVSLTAFASVNVNSLLPLFSVIRFNSECWSIAYV